MSKNFLRDNLPSVYKWVNDGPVGALGELFRVQPGLAVRYFWEEKGIEYPDTVYHYTSIDALFEILKPNDNGNKEIILSKLNHLNDAREGLYGVERLKYFDPKMESLGEDVLKLLTTFSFCDAGDYTPMWLSYGRGGKGVSIGFSVDSLCFMSADAWMPGLLRSTYDVDGTVSFYKFLKTMLELEWKDEFSSNQQLLAAYIGSVKHEDFKFEREYRLCGMERNLIPTLLSPGSPRLVKRHSLCCHAAKFRHAAEKLKVTSYRTIRLEGEEATFLESIPTFPITNVFVGSANSPSTIEAVEVFCKREKIACKVSGVRLR